MIALTLQCPSCGRNLVHSEKLLRRLEGRRGTTRCPCCRERVHFDATGPALRVTFPDLHAHTGAESLRVIAKETVSPPEVVEDRESHIVTKDGTIVEQVIPGEALQDAALPTDCWYSVTPTGQILLAPAVDDDVVIPLVQRKQSRRPG